MLGPRGSRTPNLCLSSVASACGSEEPVELETAGITTLRSLKTTPRSPFTTFSPARRLDGLPRHLLVKEAHIGVSLKHTFLHTRALLRIHTVTERGPLPTATKLHCCGSARRFGLEAAQSNYCSLTLSPAGLRASRSPACP